MMSATDFIWILIGSCVGARISEYARVLAAWSKYITRMTLNSNAVDHVARLSGDIIGSCQMHSISMMGQVAIKFSI